MVLWKFDCESGNRNRVIKSNTMIFLKQIAQYQHITINVGIIIGALGNMFNIVQHVHFIHRKKRFDKINPTQSQGQPYPGAFNACTADEDCEMLFKVPEKAG